MDYNGQVEDLDKYPLLTKNNVVVGRGDDNFNKVNIDINNNKMHL